MSDDFQTSMCHAAKNRSVVELVDGRCGTLVYWPGRAASSRVRVKPLRHGDPLMAGVRLDSEHPERVAAVSPFDIIAIVEVGS